MQPASEKPKPAERRRLRQLERASRTETSNRRLLESVAEMSGDDEMPCFTIGFKNYRSDICKIKDTNATTARKIFEGLKNIGRCYSEAQIYGLPMDMKKTTAVGYYAKYAKGLTPDIEVSEFDAGEHRGFFYVDRSSKTVEIIAVDIHPPYKKQKG